MTSPSRRTARRAGVVGCGLIGGSIAYGLRAAGWVLGASLAVERPVGRPGDVRRPEGGDVLEHEELLALSDQRAAPAWMGEAAEVHTGDLRDVDEKK